MTNAKNSKLRIIVILTLIILILVIITKTFFLKDSQPAILIDKAKLDLKIDSERFGFDFDKYISADELLLEGKYAESLSLFRQLSEESPDYYRINLKIGNNLIALGRDDEGLASYQEAFKKNSTSQRVNLAYGDYFYSRQNYTEALSYFTKTLKNSELASREQTLMAILGNYKIFLKLNRYDELFALIAPTMENPTRQVLSIHGFAYLDQGNFEQAFNYFSRANCSNCLGWYYIYLADYDAALGQFDLVNTRYGGENKRDNFMNLILYDDLFTDYGRTWAYINLKDIKKASKYLNNFENREKGELDYFDIFDIYEKYPLEEAQKLVQN